MNNAGKARAWLEAVGKGDTESVVSLMQPDAFVHTKGRSVLSAKRTLDELRALVDALGQFTKDGLHFTFQDFVSQGETVVVQFTGESELLTGARYDNEYLLLFRFRDGLVVEVHEYLCTQLVNDTVGPVIAAAQAG